MAETLPKLGVVTAISSHMRQLDRLGYSVGVVTPELEADPVRLPLEQAGFWVHHAPWSSSVEELRRRERASYDLVTLYRGPMAAAYALLVQRYQPNAQLIYLAGGLHHLAAARQAEAQRRPELLAEAGHHRKLEAWAAHLADIMIASSAGEAEAMRRVDPSGNVHSIGWCIPAFGTAEPKLERPGLTCCFSGDDAADQDALRCFDEEIVPAAAVGRGTRCRGRSGDRTAVE